MLCGAPALLPHPHPPHPHLHGHSSASAVPAFSSLDPLSDPTVPLAPPRNLKVFNATTSSLTAKWEPAPSPVQGYRLTYSPAVGGEPLTVRAALIGWSKNHWSFFSFTGEEAPVGTSGACGHHWMMNESRSMSI